MVLSRGVLPDSVEREHMEDERTSRVAVSRREDIKGKPDVEKGLKGKPNRKKGV